MGSGGGGRGCFKIEVGRYVYNTLQVGREKIRGELVATDCVSGERLREAQREGGVGGFAGVTFFPGKRSYDLEIGRILCLKENPIVELRSLVFGKDGPTWQPHNMPSPLAAPPNSPQLLSFPPTTTIIKRK